jgi:CRP-like cAMP-binding protein
MLTPVERVLILKNADLLKDVGPRHLLSLATVAHEVEIWQGQTIYAEADPADALYMIVEGRVRLTSGEKVMSEVGAGEAFGTWSLVDNSARGHRAECIEDGVALALERERFYEVAAGDPAILQELLRALAKRLRALVAERPEEARVESEGAEAPEPVSAPGVSAQDVAEADVASTATAPSAPTGASLTAAALGQPAAQTEPPPVSDQAT